MTLEELRTNFPHTQESVYVNHAATGPLSRPARAAAEAYLDQRHRTRIENYEVVQPKVGAAKRRVAKLLGTRPARVEFTMNTSAALDVLARGLDWKEGDRVALPACEFPANVYPFMNLERQGVKVDFIPHRDGTITLDDVNAALTPRTRLLSLSWVQFLSGFRTDLAAVGEICRAHGAIFCVDAIQGLGALRLDVEACGIDFLASGTQKWLMGMQGLGFLYCSERLQERLAPAAGWLHGPVDWEHFFDYELAFYPDARRFRLGTMNHAGILALGAALDLYFAAGPTWCEEQVLARAHQLAEGLEVRGFARYGTASPAHASGIVTVAVPDAEALLDHLAAEGIEAALRNGMLRFSPTYYNTPGEIEHILAAVDAFRKTRSVPHR